MAVYSKLLLSSGGGIVSKMQQADQVKNTATLLIGLGGTGIDCLQTIKTQVYSRLKPDDAESVIPTYEHIRFLGVDTAEKSRNVNKDNLSNQEGENKLDLDETEFFSIADNRLGAGFKNKRAMDMKEELSWMRWEDIPTPDLGKAGAGGIRQIGRYMMMNHSTSFMAKVKQELNSAKMGLQNPNVNIHIFSGLSGGTGSGCFLDVCYMIRSIIEENVTMFGYFFLPDVSLSKIPYQDAHTRAFIPKNGYASMQELDYCMQLQYNGGTFTQEYQNKVQIEWRKPPVDMCHLISATNVDGNVIPNAYDYAMNVTAEYIMDFLTHSDTSFGLVEHMSNFRQKIETANTNKIIGSHLAYCVIGASCANIPLKEINTYLASELFDKFSGIQRNIPTKGQVEEIVSGALARSQVGSSIYEALLRELREGAGDDFTPYTDDYKYVREYGNHRMVDHYKNQSAAKENKVVANAKSMLDMNNERSLINRIRRELVGIIRDIERGPIFANGVLQGAKTHNLLNIIDGLIAENKSREELEAAQKNLRHDDYENAKFEFEKAKIGTRKKKFQSYAFYLMCLVQHELMLIIYENMDNVLTKFRKQVVNVSADYYMKLSRVTDTLINTFQENKDNLNSMRFLRSNDTFSMPMMTIEELKDSLDNEIKNLNIPQSLNSFMNLFLENEEEWLGEDEYKITKLVTKFFVEDAFSKFSNRTITAYLKDKYDTQNDEKLANKVYDEWIKVLTEKASPLFQFNNSVWVESNTSKLAYVSIPEISAPIKKAADMIYKANNLWKVKNSGLTDRIFVMSSACALPLSSYNNCEEYERAYFSGCADGTHYYEGKKVKGLEFDDWRQLPSLTPQCLVELEKVPEPMKNLVENSQQLFEKACILHIFNLEDNTIYEPDPNFITQLKEHIEKAKQILPTIIAPEQMNDIVQLKENLQKTSELPMVITHNKVLNDGYAGEADQKRSISKDYFIAAPVYQIEVKKIIAQMETLKNECDELIQKLEKKISEVQIKGKNLIKYCNAIFTGVITMEGNIISYVKNEFGVTTDMILSKHGEDYPFKNIPIYQGYVTYLQLQDDIKDEIERKVDQAFNENLDDIIQVGKTLKETQFTDARINGWVQTSNQFTNKVEIVQFLKDFIEQFQIFCTSNMI